jgi:hypothetical protein
LQPEFLVIPQKIENNLPVFEVKKDFETAVPENIWNFKPGIVSAFQT